MTFLIPSIGTKVEVGPEADAIQGHISAVTIRRGDVVQYEVVFWDGKSRRSEWLFSTEVRIKSSEPQMKIGFV